MSTFSDNASRTRLLTHLAHMRSLLFPPRSHVPAPQRGNAVGLAIFVRTAMYAGVVLALCRCGPPSWPGGIHAVLGASPRGLRVVQVPEDSPAQRAGLRAGDFIVAIEGREVKGLSPEELRGLLTGEVGSTALLLVARDDGRTEVRVQRAPYGEKR